MTIPFCRGGAWLAVQPLAQGHPAQARQLDLSSGCVFPEPPFTTLLSSRRLNLDLGGRKGQVDSCLLCTFASLRFQVSLFMVLPLRANFPSPQCISGGSRRTSVSKAALACAGAGAQDQEDLMLSGRRGAGAGFSGVPPVSSGDATWSWCQARPRGEEPACASLSPWSRTFTG